MKYGEMTLLFFALCGAWQVGTWLRWIIFPWYGQVIFTGDSRPGVIGEHKFKTKEEAAAFVAGFNEAKETTDGFAHAGDIDQLEDYQAIISLTEAEDE